MIIKHIKYLLSAGGSRTGYIDMTLNLLLGFISMVLILLMILRTHDVPTETNMISPGHIMIKLTWTEASPADVDLWVKSDDPAHYTSFKSKKNTLMFLDRDDLGDSGDFSVMKNGERISNLNNSEIIYITFKGKNRYAVNIHMYNVKGAPLPEDCIVELIVTDPSYRVVYTKNLKLYKVGEEKTAFTFTTDASGMIDNVGTDIEEKFVYKELGNNK